VGDLIDRGPAQVETTDLVRHMTDAGSARCILGNHEFNAIAWVTPDPERPGEFLRPHGKPGNLNQHRAFLDAVAGLSHAQLIDWFKTLPLWLDLGKLRVVHACWHEDSMKRLAPLLGADNRLTEELILRGSRPGDWAYEALEIICKGPEVALPDGVGIPDREGKMRHDVRVRWWLPEIKSLREAAIVPPGNEARIPDVPLPPEMRSFRYSGPPVLFGHYWFSGVPQVISAKFACLDYSVAKGGPLVAYRWDGESKLSSDKLAWV
jgi:hypothetical protein